MQSSVLFGAKTVKTLNFDRFPKYYFILNQWVYVITILQDSTMYEETVAPLYGPSVGMELLLYIVTL